MQIVIEISEEIYNVLKLNLIAHGTIEEEMIVEAVRKGTPLHNECDIQRIVPKRVNVQKWVSTKCPNQNCNYELSIHYGDGYYSIEHKPNFCPICGQSLLWESGE